MGEETLLQNLLTLDVLRWETGEHVTQLLQHYGLLAIGRSPLVLSVANADGDEASGVRDDGQLGRQAIAATVADVRGRDDAGVDAAENPLEAGEVGAAALDFGKVDVEEDVWREVRGSG